MPCYEDIMVCAEVRFERELIHGMDTVIRATAETQPPLGQNKKTTAVGHNHDHGNEKSWKQKGHGRVARQYLRHA
jgi:hypothetical protein